MDFIASNLNRSPVSGSLGAICALLLCAVAMMSGDGLAQVPQPQSRTPPARTLTVGADGAVSVASDDEAYFDYSSYAYNLMRQVRIDLTADLRVTNRISLLADVRGEGSTGGGKWRLRPYAAFVRFRPFVDRAIDIQAGLVPPVFGSFTRRAYSTDNPLIGFPLAYQYLTSLRPDAVPASADDLFRGRGRGWLVGYPVGNAAHAHGLPLVDGLRDQSGVEAHFGDGRPVEAAASVTSGSLSRPALHAGNAGRQISGRLAVRPATGLVLGVSASRGVFLDESIVDATSDDAGHQTAFGFDGEYSQGHWLLRVEGVASRWKLPRLGAPPVDRALSAFAIDAEGRYRILPGLYVAARAGRLTFGEITGSTGSFTWDLPVTRLEAGGGYSLLRNAIVKFAWQHNWREQTGYAYSGRLVSAQLLVWY